MFNPGASGVTMQYLLLKISLFTTGVALPVSAWVATWTVICVPWGIPLAFLRNAF